MRSVASVALFLIAAFAQPARSVSQTPPDNDTRELMHLEDVWNQAHVAGDADALGRLWADDLEIAVPHMAVMTRAEALGFARSGRMKFLHYETSDLHVRVYGDAAVVTGRLLRTRSMNGNETSDDWRFTKVYIRQAHQWRVVSFHASDSPAP
jgi:ketosteroid isomerase-like protein